MSSSAAPSTPETDSAPALDHASAAPRGAPPALRGAALRHLRALGHDLKPTVMLGKEGLTEALVGAANAALLTHELIKVKILSEAPVDRHEAARQLAGDTKSVLAQVLGRTVLLYRRHPKKPKIVLPK
ncbi:YhbY family RNA-binding protein [Pendulispora albinea]|uniref:YhbY family RNA-binding protein n=1 Tax=Pendulispora albinea TaxID=2741071 RepID=A0ABZ2LU34_9BACT